MECCSWLGEGMAWCTVKVQRTSSLSISRGEVGGFIRLLALLWGLLRQHLRGEDVTDCWDVTRLVRKSKLLGSFAIKFTSARSLVSCLDITKFKHSHVAAAPSSEAVVKFADPKEVEVRKQRKFYGTRIQLLHQHYKKQIATIPRTLRP